MMISYDYSEFIAELFEDLRLGCINLDGEIQILRSEDSFYYSEEVPQYHPVIDYYYSTKLMTYILAPAHYYEGEYARPEIIEARKDYEEDKPNLISVRVKEILAELLEVNRIIKF